LLADCAALAHAQRAAYSCADGTIKDWYEAGIKIKVLSGCVIAMNVAENIASSGAIVDFDLVPDPASRRLLNAHNASFGGVITVYVYGRRRIHGQLLNGVRVRVAAPWAHDLTHGWNDLPAAQSVDVLPKALALH
jgi:hypothetical protein